MLLKDFCIKYGFEEKYKILKDKTNECLKQFRMKKSNFNKPEYSFKHTRKFLFDNVESYTYDYEFGIFNNVVDLNSLTKKQFDQLSLCILKDFLEDPELSSVETFFKSMDETISFGFESVIKEINDHKEYFDKYVFKNKEMFLGYSIEKCCYKSYLLKNMNLNN